MAPLDLHEQEWQLNDLAKEFEVLRARVGDLSYTPGVDALRQIGPLLHQAQDLTAVVLVRLNALHNSSHAGVIDGRSSLKCLSSVVVAASLVSNALARTLHANPDESMPFPGRRVEDAPARIARQAKAIRLMNGHLDEAARQLELCARGCRSAATHVARNRTAAQARRPEFA
ncbi:hypothetical protein ACF1AE_25030 [Streptomyces sp. NPDC014986]|uniref:hypothetical protein n=1 Tax=Streptomyces sp. NPDC014986 TaxID=3364934 RepID=UPI003700B49B